MRLVFMGTPDFAVPSLRALVQDGHEVLAVFTQPDRPAGRGKKLKSSPVKVAAEDLKLPVLQPAKIKFTESVAQLSQLAPDCIVVVAYGQILSREILAIPTYGCINVHASLLPAYRGAAPIHWAVMKGEGVTGVTTMYMDEGLDTGDMLLKAEIPILPEMTTGEVHDTLAELGGQLIARTLQMLEAKRIRPIPQSGDYSYAPLLTREDELIHWDKSAGELHNQIRGLNPWPVAFTSFKGEMLKIWRSEMKSWDTNPVAKQPGEIIKIDEDGLWVQTGNREFLKITEVQPAGKRRMPARDFFVGRHGVIGEVFG